jgi:hypothetical protein
METLKTALLIDGSNLPPALRIAEGDRKDYITQGRAGDKPRNFKFVRSITGKVEGEAETRTLYLYRLVGLSDEDFEAIAMQTADEYLNPERYMKVSGKPLANDERTELEQYRRKFGALK